MIGFTVGFKGVDAFEEKLAQRLGEMRQRVAVQMRREGELIIGDAKENYVPVDTGYLKSTGYVKGPTLRGSGPIEVQLGFSADYAMAVHEGFAQHQHRNTDGTFGARNGGRKYLTRPLLARMRGMMARVAKAAQG